MYKWESYVRAFFSPAEELLTIKAELKGPEYFYLLCAKKYICGCIRNQIWIQLSVLKVYNNV